MPSLDDDSVNLASTIDESLRPHSTHATIKWLEQNYRLEDGICLPRSTIYEHYSDFCQRERIQPVNAASFGKIIRQQFPTLTTRRLGTRGQSKYHYFGLGIKPSSRYYSKDYVEKITQGVTKKTQEVRKTTFSEKPSAVLPPFPDMNSLHLSDGIPVDKLKTFMVMYRAHCQRILDSIVRANFSEVESFLLHFWQGMPTHMLPVLASSVVVDLVAFCDSLLYKVISNLLIISPLQNLPESLLTEIRQFTDMLRPWMENALKGLPESLQEAKYKIAEGFVNGLKRQTSLTKLAQITRNELRGSSMLEQLRQDWIGIDLSSVFTQTMYSMHPLGVPLEYWELVPHFLREFGSLLSDKSELEHFIFWSEDVVNSTVIKAHKEHNYPLKESSQLFLLTWKFFISKVSREFTMESAPSFGCFILLHMLVDDYIVHLLESHLEKQEERVYAERLDRLKKDDDSITESLHSISSSPLASGMPLAIANGSSTVVGGNSGSGNTPLQSHPSSACNSPSLLPDIHGPPSKESSVESNVGDVLAGFTSGISVPGLAPPLDTYTTSSTLLPSTGEMITTVTDRHTPIGHDIPVSSDPPLHLPVVSSIVDLDPSRQQSGMKTGSSCSQIPDFGMPSATSPIDMGPPPHTQSVYHQMVMSPPQPLPSGTPPAATSYQPPHTSMQQSNFQPYQQQGQLYSNRAAAEATVSTASVAYGTQRICQPHATSGEASSSIQFDLMSGPPTFPMSIANPIYNISPSTLVAGGGSAPGSLQALSTAFPARQSGRSSQQQQQQQVHSQQPPQQQHSSNPGSLHSLPGNSSLGNSSLGNMANLAANSSLTSRASNMGGMVAPVSLSNFPAFNIPLAHSGSSTIPTSSTSSTLAPAAPGNLPLLQSLPAPMPGVYPYAPFVGIPAPVNPQFAPGLPMTAPPTGTATAMSGYSYIPPSLYNTQVSSASFTR